MSTLSKAVIASSQQKKSIFEKLGAVFAIDAKYSKSGEQWVLNRGSGGQVLRARYGSVGRAEIRNGVGLVTPSNSGNTPTVPDSVSLRISGTLEILGRFEGNTRPATTGYLALKSTDGTYANRWYGAVLYNSGQLGLWCRDTAMNSVDKGSVSAIPSTTTAFWWKVNVNPVTGVFNFYYAPDQIDEPTSWTDLGGTTGSFVGNAILTGSGGDVRGHHLVDGVQKRLMIRNAIGSGTILDIDFTAQPDFTTSFTCTTGQNVTVTAANAVDTNDPLWLSWNGENYMYTPGTVNNLAASSSSAETYGTGFQIRMRLQASTWSGIYNICGHALGATPASRNVLMLISAGYLVVGISDGAGSYWSTCPTIPAGVLPTDRPIWVSATGVLNAGTITTMYEWAEDSPQEPTSWTSLGSTPTAFPGAIQGASFPFNFGSAYQNGTGSDFAGRTYRGIFRNGAGSTLIDADFTRNTGHSSFVCATGQTITFNRSATGRKTTVVTRPIWLFGTDDYLEVADNALLDFGASDEFSLVVIARLHGTPSAPAMIAKKASYAAADVGYSASINGGLAPRFTLADGSTRAEADGGAVLTSGNVFVASTVASSTQVTTRMNTSAGSTLSKPAGTLANALPLRIGTMSASTSSPLDGEILAVGIFRRALSATEIAQIVSAYRAG